MRILFIRHGDPDYENDTLTEKGRREAAHLAQMAPSMKIDDCYMSPLGRAQATASCSLKAMGKTAAVLDWLKEFPAKADLSLFEELADAYGHGPEENSLYGIRNVVWDMLPSYWTRHPEYSDVDRWQQSAAAKSGDAVHVYKHVCREFDRLLETAITGWSWKIPKPLPATATTSSYAPSCPTYGMYRPLSCGRASPWLPPP